MKKSKWGRGGLGSRGRWVEILESRRLMASTPSGLTPADVRAMYGMDGVSFNGITGDGAGQTIAVVVAYDHPGFVNSTDPSYASSDLAIFNRQFGLPDPPSFTKIGSNSTTAPAPSDWMLEAALDVQWAHAMAPKANLVMVVAGSASVSMMYNGVQTAVYSTDASVISLSWGMGEAGEMVPDYYLSSLDQPITFVAASGDWGRPGLTPSSSASLLSVGGTYAARVDGQYVETRAWEGSGGGYSSWDKLPSWQASLPGAATGQRMFPDVAALADPASGAAVYSSQHGGWTGGVGGTSLAAPIWAGFLATVNQGRVLAGKRPLDGASETLPAIYAAPAAAFNDLSSGNNGFAAGTGYDLVSGRGSMKGPQLATYLVGYGQSSTVRSFTGLIYQSVKPGWSSNFSGTRGVPGVTVFVDADRDNRLDAGEISTVTGAGGRFSFTGLSTNTPTIGVVLGKFVTGFYYSGTRQRGTFANISIGQVTSQPSDRPGTIEGAMASDFGTGGRQEFNYARDSSPSHIVPIAGGGWLALESVVPELYGETRVVRYLPSGEVDPAFGTGGYSVVQRGGLVTSPRQLLVAADGSILVLLAYHTPSVNNQPYDRSWLGIVKFRADGTLDTSFATGGVMQYEVRAMAGVVAGWLGDNGAIYLIANNGFTEDSMLGAVWRFTAGGVLDTSFGSGGSRILSPGPRHPIVGARQSPDGGIILVGRSAPLAGMGGAWVRRLSTTGVIDESFGYGSQVALFNSDSDTDIQFDAAGRVYVSVTGTDGFITRLTPQGRYDTTFGRDGWIVAPQSVTPNARKFNVLEDGSLLLMQCELDGTITARHVFADGGLDTRFGALLLSTPRSDESQARWEGPLQLSRLSNGTYLLAARGLVNVFYYAFRVTDVTVPPPPPPPVGGVVLQAESAVLSGGTYKSTSHAGYTGTGFADYGGNGSAAQWSFDWPADQLVTLEFRYANGSTGSRPLAVQVNGVTVGTIACAPTGGWTTWSTVSIAVSLKAGLNVLKAIAGTSGGANLDAVTLTSQAPSAPTARTGGTYAVAEGGSITLNGSASASWDGTPLAKYEWDFNYNGATFDIDATGATPQFSAGSIDGMAQRTVALRVTDVDGRVAIAATQVTISNVAPTGTFAGGGGVQLGEASTVGFTSASDPSSGDLAAGLLYSFDFNNDGDFTDPGDVLSSTFATASHTFATAGTHTIRGRVADDDGGYTDYTTTVSVEGQAPAVEAITLQAEAGVMSGGTVKASNHSGYQGSGFADYAGSGSAVQWSVNWSATGSATLELRYANGSTGNRPLTVQVNGVNVGSLTCAPTGGWSSWATLSLAITLQAGVNSIKAIAGAAGGANVDQVTLSGSGTVVPPPPPPPPPPTGGTTGSISGSTFNDSDADGILDATESKAGGKTVFLDSNNNGRLDSGEKSMVSDASGNFSFTGLGAGTYFVRRVFPKGYTYSTPPRDVSLDDGETARDILIGSRTI